MVFYVDFYVSVYANINPRIFFTLEISKTKWVVLFQQPGNHYHMILG